MIWEIKPFEGVGPIRFGMSASEVEAVIGPPDSRRKGDDTEYRGDRAPIVSYDDGKVTEIECYYDIEGGVTLDGLDLFGRIGLEVMRELERRNGGALESVGMVLFEDLGITTGRLDQSGREDNSVTAFARGLWAGRTGRMKPVFFL